MAFRALHNGDRVSGHDILLDRDLHAHGHPAGRFHVGDVDDPGIGLPALDLLELRLHVQFKGDLLDLHPLPVEGLARVLAGRDGRGGEDDLEVRAREITQAPDRLRVARGDHDLEEVPGEIPRRLDEVARHELLHDRLVGGRHDVRRSTRLDLGDQLLRAGEAECQGQPRVGHAELGPVVGEGFAERGGREDDQGTRQPRRRRCRRPRLTAGRKQDTGDDKGPERLLPTGHLLG
jgi:hypothetical protein